MCVCSSGDSTGVKPDDQKARYDEVVKRRPDTILSLENEVYGMFIFYFFPLFNVNFFAECIFYVFFFFFFRIQRVNPCCLLFVVVWYEEKCFFTDMKSFHTRSKSFKKQDTNWLQLLNVLGNNLIILGVILLHEMYVKSFLFSPAYFWLIWGGRILGIVKVFPLYN